MALQLTIASDVQLQTLVSEQHWVCTQDPVAVLHAAMDWETSHKITLHSL